MGSVFDEIEARRVQFSGFFGVRDFAGAGACYTDDCRYMTPGQQLIRGKDAVRGFIEKAFSDDSLGGMRFIGNDVHDMEDGYAVERGSWDLTQKDGTLIVKGSHLILWKKIDSHWYIHWECETMDA